MSPSESDTVVTISSNWTGNECEYSNESPLTSTVIESHVSPTSTLWTTMLLTPVATPAKLTAQPISNARYRSTKNTSEAKTARTASTFFRRNGCMDTCASPFALGSCPPSASLTL